MAFKFNPFTGTLDEVSAGGGGGTPGGSDTEVQFNDGGAFGGDADFTYNKTSNLLTLGGDINLDDGGTFTTTLQTVTATANRTISFPDATGTVALVAGSSGQVVYNNAGAYAGVSTMTFDGTSVTLAGRLINSYNGTASSPAKVFTGTWFTGGTSTTTKPHFLIEPSGATSTAWSTSGTGLGVNAASGFAGNLLDLQVNGTSRFSVSNGGVINQSGSSNDFVGVNLANASSGAGASTGFTATNNSSSALFSRVYGSGVTAPVWGITLAGYGGIFSEGANSNGLLVGTLTNDPLIIGTNTGERLRFGGSGGITVADAQNIAVGTTTGTKIGTATTQKLGFYDKTPVVQPTAVADATDAATAITQLNALLARMRDLGLIAT